MLQAQIVTPHSPQNFRETQIAALINNAENGQWRIEDGCFVFISHARHVVFGRLRVNRWRYLPQQTGGKPLLVWAGPHQA